MAKIKLSKNRKNKEILILPKSAKIISSEVAEGDIKVSPVSINERKPDFKVNIDVPFAELETCINFMKKIREVFKDADLEINIRSPRYWK